MKIKVQAMTIKTIEVDDKFNALAVDDPNYVYYPFSKNLYDELMDKIEKETDFSSDWSNDNFSVPKIIVISRISDNSIMYQA